MKRAIIACGGTGGHMSPGIALAEELTSRNWNCTLLISNKQVDSRLVKKYRDFDYETVDGRPFSIRPNRLVLFLISLVRGTIKCTRMIHAKKPDVVIGFGGFLSMPAMLAGFLAGLPTVIHEANRVAGRVTRIVSWFARRIYLPKGVSVRTKRSSRIRYVGMPVRNEIVSQSKSAAKRKLGLDPRLNLLVIMGGSQGAESLNKWVKASLPILAQKEVQVFCLTGGGTEADSSMTFKSPKGTVVRSLFRRFSDDMATVLSAADLVVSRSGAGSIAEMMRCRAPGILIPFPFSADDHQVENAKNFESLGCGIHMSQDYIGDLLKEVQDVLFNEWLMQKFRHNLELADRADVRSFMANDLERIVSGNGLSMAARTEQRLRT
ncbi:UDP-N-acetylglucosamine--N-acetylmuramyl-(pentapeptide) pyrophosphoryl-undecaprenol N-acetylglucosamine transferase [Pelagicoccus sp. SDUM812002]|uniref:UDP-N-acetylglucosamine--N-acetylmuramyl- (pentapeptide) pyrophosphoryl-undecaprenol N-acetylglucosamine transferase n=1 Tax=Pelagicoccus sp. SDUM812002 TaxID=3041266 RepID=UPI00280EEF93|nr:UDP-N-acetylglucosamine--N-acetylmuramyl-(pentapeptide) pyrophosphoryl-undecaprenol N-acetylglucosamine transferase [Pelagicoccus sp. SDUM812002]MDQ8185456.1 UDP-N-acetylglucosamine--N-acetylmuramyl-(pentapeptide) pyrophosphoryl-undecaprenol N-acetylglucosamine transferase [Pelagicoccus sp. SDUM812002]